VAGTAKPDIAKLAPAELARQLGHPEGTTGIAVGDFMHDSNAALYRAIVQRLDPQAGERILEVGFGNGKHAAWLLNLAPDLRYDGVDISQIMVAEALTHNRALVQAGRAGFHRAASDALPFPDRSFERALAVNAVYFWAEPARDLAELRRVLKPGGLLCLAAFTRETADKMRFTRHGFRIHDAAELERLCRQAGFGGAAVEAYHETIRRLDGGSMERDYHFVLARRD
jgi:ubiquinone/menaquinone biosynthesis C-methylase UbiE